MVRAWFIKDSNDDQRLEQHRDPPQYVEEDYLREHGILYWKIDVDNLSENETLEKIKKERGYNYEDEITVSREELPDFEEKIKGFFKEHLHVDEEIRLCMEGSGYFDFRDRNDCWMRIAFEKGDLLILPAGVHHRFTLDTKNYMKAKRYFSGEPVWTAHYRMEGKLHPKFEEYVHKRDNGLLL